MLMEEKGTLKGNWLGQPSPPWRADVSSGQRMGVRLARGSIILSFRKVDCRKKKKVLCILVARSHLLHVCLYPQETMFSLLEGGF